MLCRMIEIDFDVHRRIEAERQGFHESPNDVLRRLLDMGKSPNEQRHAEASAPGAWSGKGVTLPAGTEIRMTYRRQRYFGRIENGQWWVAGHSYASPSAAASKTARTRQGKPTVLDGWRYWQVRRPGDAEWTPLRDLKRLVP